MADVAGTSTEPPPRAEKHEAPPAVVIVADDLSSATDCGVRMILGGYLAVVLLHPESALPADLDIVALDTDSRNMSPEGAYSATWNCAGTRHFDGCAVVYKSVERIRTHGGS